MIMMMLGRFGVYGEGRGVGVYDGFNSKCIYLSRDLCMDSLPELYIVSHIS